MKPFNLQEALAGRAVITRDGQKVTQLTFFKDVTGDKYELAGIVDGAIATWTKDGLYYGEDDYGQDGKDLYMGIEKKAVYLNLYPDGTIRFHKDKDAAERNCEASGRTVTAYYED